MRLLQVVSQGYSASFNHVESLPPTCHRQTDEYYNSWPYHDLTDPSSHTRLFLARPVSDCASHTRPSVTCRHDSTWHCSDGYQRMTFLSLSFFPTDTSCLVPSFSSCYTFSSYPNCCVYFVSVETKHSLRLHLRSFPGGSLLSSYILLVLIVLFNGGRRQHRQERPRRHSLINNNRRPERQPT